MKSPVPTRLTSSESAYLHTAACNNTRVYFDGQQRLNTASSGTNSWQSNWPSQVTTFTSASSAWTNADGGAVELDTMNWVDYVSYTLNHGGPTCENANQAQVTSQQANIATYQSGQDAVFNGVDYDYPDDYTGGSGGGSCSSAGCYNDMMNALPSNILGGFNEDAITTVYGDGYMTNASPVTNAWTQQMDGIFSVLGHGYYDFLWLEGVEDTAHRTYGLASYYLSYTLKYSVLWEDYCFTDSSADANCNAGGDSTWDDKGFVPQDPVQTASVTSATSPYKDITTLESGTSGVFFREFRHCYLHGTDLGHCVAIVNANGSGSGSTSVPTLTYSYAHALSLPTAPLDTASGSYLLSKVSQTQPTTINAASAYILIQ